MAWRPGWALRGQGIQVGRLLSAQLCAQHVLGVLGQSLVPTWTCLLAPA